MHTERRHELETNWLAKNLPLWGERLRPYSSAIMAAAGALVVLYLGFAFWSRWTQAREQEAWDEYQLAVLQGDLDLKQVERVAAGEDFDGAAMQEWAYITWADRQLRLAAETYLQNRDAAKERLNTIAGRYEVLAQAAVDDEVRNRARLGLARVSEMLNDLDDARKQYALVEGPLKPIAEARLKELESQQTEHAVQWLATAALPKRTPPAGGALPGQRPDLDVTLPPTDGAGAEFDAARTLEEILGGLSEGERDESRYGGEASTGPAAGETPGDADQSDATGTTDATSEQGVDRSQTSGAADPADLDGSSQDQPASNEQGDNNQGEAADSSAEGDAQVGDSPGQQ